MNVERRGRKASGPSRIVVADDHPIFRQALRDILQEASATDLEVVGEARDGQEAIELCRSLQPDLVLMDVSMPGMDGLEATREIKRRFPRTIVLMLTAMEQPEYLSEALRAGASGYIIKDLSSQRLINSIRRVLDGEFPMNQELAAQLLGQLLLDKEEAPKEEAPLAASFALVSPSPNTHHEPSLLGSLSPREVDVLRLVGRGHTNQQIARSLLISTSTVKNHMHNIISKLGVSDRTQAAVLAVRAGLLSEENTVEG